MRAIAGLSCIAAMGCQATSAIVDPVRTLLCGERLMIDRDERGANRSGCAAERLTASCVKRAHQSITEAARHIRPAARLDIRSTGSSIRRQGQNILRTDYMVSHLTVELLSWPQSSTGFAHQIGRIGRCSRSLLLSHNA